MNRVVVATTLDGALALERRNLLCSVTVLNADGTPTDPQIAATATILWRRHAMSGTAVTTALTHLPAVRHLHTDKAGTDDLPASLIARRGITVTAAHETQTRGVAEWVAAAILWDAKRLDTVQRHSDERRWAPADGITSPAGGLLASLGAGRILSRAVPLLHGLGIDVVATTRTGRPRPGVDVLSWDEWLTRLPGASWLLLDVPLTESTRHAVDAGVLSLLDGACLINLARGAVLAPGAVVLARRQGWLRSAVLDVHDVEPLPAGSPLWDDPRVLVTPHQAWRTQHTATARVHEFVQHLPAYATVGENGHSPSRPNAVTGVSNRTGSASTQ